MSTNAWESVNYAVTIFFYIGLLISLIFIYIITIYKPRNTLFITLLIFLLITFGLSIATAYFNIKRYNKIKNEDDNDAVVLINPYTNKGMLYRTGLSGAIFAPILFIIFILAGIYLLYAYKEDKNNAM